MYMTGFFKGIIKLIDRAEDRPEILEVRKRVLTRLKWPVLVFGFAAAFMGAVQSFQQGRFFFSAAYLGIYSLVIIVFVLDGRIPFSCRARVFILGLYGIAVAGLIRIGLSGVGLEIMILACVLSAVFWGVKTSLFITGISILVITGVASGLGSGFFPFTKSICSPRFPL
jgi:hypothetical protein